MMNQFPEALKKCPFWCLHIKKVPYGLNNKKVQLNDPKQFVNLDLAEEALNHGNFDGLELRIPSGWGCIDLDHCVDQNGNLSQLAHDVIQIFPGAYWEWSPSGTGLHGWIRVDDLTWWSDELYKTKTKEVEFYLGNVTNRVITVTGKPYPSSGASPDKDYSQEARKFVDRYLRRSDSNQFPSKPAPNQIEEALVQDAFEEFSEDSAILDLMLHSRSSDKVARLLAGDWEEDYPSQSEADQALSNHLAFFTRKNTTQMDRIFRETGLMRDKWDERRGAKTYGQMTIERAIQSCTAVYNPSYHVPENGQKQQDASKWLVDQNVYSNPRYVPNDMGNGYLLADWTRSFARYCPEAKAWFYYENGVWGKDIGGVKVAEAAKELTSALYRYLGTLNDEREKEAFLKVIRRWFSSGSRRTFIEEAKSVHPIPMACFDTKKFLLNCQNGTLDLETGNFYNWDPEDLLTRKAGASYDPTARCERWETFIEEIMPNDDETAAFLQQWSGYCLTGDVSHEKAVILYGRTTRNGKSTFCETLATMLGDYAAAANPESFGERRQRDGSGPSEDIARLRGCRLVTVAEPSQQLQLDAARLKSITGGDPITARFLGENSFTYDAEFKLMFNSNVLPAINDMTVFYSGRLMVVPFDRHFKEEEQDKTLKRTLRDPKNLSAVLNWSLVGFQKMWKKDLKPSAAMSALLEEYRIENDKLSRFIEDSLPLSQDKGVRIKASDVYSKYTNWCHSHGHRAESQAKFLSALRDRGVEVDRKRPSEGGTTTTVIVGRNLIDSDYKTEEV